ncbi:MAG: glycosyltransferase family 4 protein [Verrucomicrobia bacterium]|nr:glycosyltransferase family 4 protein [Verrucomicrobiota bacterium]
MSAKLPRILFLHHAGIVGGAELHLLSLVRHFGSRARVLLFSDGPFREMLDSTGVSVRVLRSKWTTSGVRGGTPRFNVVSVADVLRLGWATAEAMCDADVVWANSPRALFVASVAQLIRRRPLVWYLHDLLEPSHFSASGIRLIVSTANARANRVLTNSRAAADAFVRAGGRAELIHVLYYGFEVPPLSPEPSNATRTTGVFGRITPWKGHDVVLRALARVPNVTAIFVGDEEDPDYANELRRLARELNVQDRIRFLGFRENVAELMRSVGCIVHASTAPEPFGRVVVEAMLAQRPVIATNAGGVGEIVEHGVSGLLVSPRNVDALAGAIRRIFEHPAESRLMAERGRERAMEMFSEERMFRQIEQHLTEVLSDR